VLKILLASLIMGTSAYGTLYLIEPALNTRTGLGLLIQAGTAAFLAVLVYLAATYTLGLSQSRKLISYFKSLFS
jgi:hypothetical protein